MTFHIILSKWKVTKTINIIFFRLQHCQQCSSKTIDYYLLEHFILLPSGSFSVSEKWNRTPWKQQYGYILVRHFIGETWNMVNIEIPDWEVQISARCILQIFFSVRQIFSAPTNIIARRGRGPAWWTIVRWRKRSWTRFLARKCTTRDCGRRATARRGAAAAPPSSTSTSSSGTSPPSATWAWWAGGGGSNYCQRRTIELTNLDHNSNRYPLNHTSST